MFRVFCDNPFEQWTRFAGFVLAQQTLAEMCPCVDVLRVTFERCAIARLGFVQLSLLKIDIAQLRVVMRFIQMMDLRLEFFDPAPIVGAGKLKPTR